MVRSGVATADDVAGPSRFLCGAGAASMMGQVRWINEGVLTP
jgi:hypothetical protein